jgi:hypothetical protein
MNKLNYSSKILTFYTFYKILISPLFGLITPLITVLIPYIVLVWKFNLPISLYDYTKSLFAASTTFLKQTNNLKFIAFMSYGFSIFFYIQGVFNSIFISKTTYQISSYIENKMRGVYEFLNASREILNTYWTDDIYGSYLNNKSKNVENIDKFIYSYQSMKSIGSVLKSYKYINRDLICEICERVYIIDSLKSCVQFKFVNMFCFPEYNDGNEIVLSLKDVCHPCIDIEKVITNNFEYDGNNIIITGPNAGGKSTFLKSIAISVLLSQTICISNSSRCVITPFENIISQINIPDCKGKESLFEAEMHRCKTTLDIVNQDKRTFIVMDELFNSTNPVEGISGSYAVCKNLAKHENALIILTTHYGYLTKLSSESRYRNIRMSIIQHSDRIEFPYIIDDGISKQYIALELLKSNGFDSTIIDEALSLKSKILSLTNSNT